MPILDIYLEAYEVQFLNQIDVCFCFSKALDISFSAHLDEIKLILVLVAFFLYSEHVF